MMHRFSLYLLTAVAATGIWPYKDHRGREFNEKDGYKYTHRGKALNPQGKRMVFIGFTGDWMFMVS